MLAAFFLPPTMRSLTCARTAACAQCRSRSTCTLLAGGAEASHASTFAALSSGMIRPHASLPEKSVFRRELPDELVAFSSDRGRTRFAEAMAAGHVEPYFPLIEQFVTQDEPTFCGLGTLTMVMNALRIDPRRRWRDETGPGWRWWSDDMFPTSCTGTLEHFRVNGSTMEEFGLLAAANGAEVRMHRPTDEGQSLETFRQAMLEAGSTTSSSFTVSSFCRAALGQTGAGHFSPIGGYHGPSDSALVLDVARFKYPPYWVPVPRLWQASLKVDEVTGRARGWFLLRASDTVNQPP